MRLIDADALDSILQYAQAECKKNGGNFRYGVLSNIRANIAAAPTIDAIPVTWLRNLCAIAKMETDDEMFIDWLIQTWQQEQEAR